MRIFGNRSYDGRLAAGLLTVVLVAVASVALAGSVTVPNTFSSGEVISASAVNANFAAMEAAVNDNDSRIAANANALSSIEYASLAGVPHNPGLPATDTNLGSISVTCPSAGYIQVTFEGMTYIDGTATLVDVGINTTTSLDGSRNTSMGTHPFSDATRSYLLYFPFSLSAVHPCSAGQSRTFYALGKKIPGNANQFVGMNDMRLTGLFVPNRY